MTERETNKGSSTRREGKLGERIRGPSRWVKTAVHTGANFPHGARVPWGLVCLLLPWPLEHPKPSFQPPSCAGSGPKLGDPLTPSSLHRVLSANAVGSTFQIDSSPIPLAPPPPLRPAAITSCLHCCHLLTGLPTLMSLPTCGQRDHVRT